MHISVIIPNLNSTMIDQTLDALRQQRFDLSQVEVLVVGLDQPGLVVEDNLVRFISTGKPASPARARNIGLAAAQGQLLCFTDADCLPTPDWLAQLADACTQPGVAIVGGGVIFTANNYWSQCDNVSWFHEYTIEARAGERPLLPSLNLCIKRSVYEQVGGFDERYPRPAGEDAEWTTRIRQAGYTLHFHPEIIVHHKPSRSSFESFIRHSYTYGLYSIKVTPAYADFLQTPFVLRRWWTLLMAMPLLALAITAKIYQQNRWVRQNYPHCAWGIYLSKIVWCLGAARSLYKEGK